MYRYKGQDKCKKRSSRYGFGIGIFHTVGAGGVYGFLRPIYLGRSLNLTGVYILIRKLYAPPLPKIIFIPPPAICQNLPF
jgi:hypothetical protein